MDLQFKTVPFEIDTKASKADGSAFAGHASIFFNPDSYREIVDDGAFDQDIDGFLADGFVGGLNHDWDNPIGNPSKAVRDQKGLYVACDNVLETSHGKDVRMMLAAKVVKF